MKAEKRIVPLQKFNLQRSHLIKHGCAAGALGVMLFWYGRSRYPVDLNQQPIQAFPTTGETLYFTRAPVRFLRRRVSSGWRADDSSASFSLRRANLICRDAPQISNKP